MPSLGDMLFAFSEWLRTTPIVEMSLWISEQPFSLKLGSHFLTIPIVQTIHILAIAAAFGSVLMINLRILGITGGTQAIDRTARRFVPWIWSALAVLLLTGLTLVIGEPVRELVNPIFWIKMVLVVALVLASLWFQGAARRTMLRPDIGAGGGAAVRAGAVGIIVLWCVVIFAGRWIAYAPV